MFFTPSEKCGKSVQVVHSTPPVPSLIVSIPTTVNGLCGPSWYPGSLLDIAVLTISHQKCARLAQSAQSATLGSHYSLSFSVSHTRLEIPQDTFIKPQGSPFSPHVLEDSLNLPHPPFSTSEKLFSFPPISCSTQALRHTQNMWNSDFSQILIEAYRRQPFLKTVSLIHSRCPRHCCYSHITARTHEIFVRHCTGHQHAPPIVNFISRPRSVVYPHHLSVSTAQSASAAIGTIATFAIGEIVDDASRRLSAVFSPPSGDAIRVVRTSECLSNTVSVLHSSSITFTRPSTSSCTLAIIPALHPVDPTISASTPQSLIHSHQYHRRLFLSTHVLAIVAIPITSRTHEIFINWEFRVPPFFGQQVELATLLRTEARGKE
ncbi:hypothetical protein BD779DRAFT_1809263 [Infundibulicybe gibba]|nr:hypothetical protein BD779DRAFT_1809263 [Infundibulicybe gibba]